MKILVRFLGFFCPQKKRTKKSRHQDGIVLTVPDDLCYDSVTVAEEEKS